MIHKDVTCVTEDIAVAEPACTPLQRAMVRRGRISTGDGVNVQQVIVTLREGVRPDLLRAAWNLALGKHDALRMSFDEAGDSAVFAAEAAMPWREEKGRMDEFLSSDRRAGFDFSEAPLMRAALLQSQTAEWCMVWTYHHAILDGRSAALVLQDVFAAYDALMEGRACEVPSRPSFKSHLLSRSAGRSKSGSEFWRANLAGVVRGTMFEPPLPDVDRAGACEGRISRKATALLQEFAARHDCSFASIVHAAWALVLGRQSGTDDVVFGEVRSCRPADARDLVGMCVNTVPLRIRVEPTQSLADWICGIGEHRRALRQYESADLEAIQQWTGAESLVPTVVMYDHRPFDAAVRQGMKNPDGCSFEMREDTGMPLTLRVFGGEELTFDFQARPFLPSAALALAVQRFSAALENIAAAAPGALVGDVSVADENERRAIAEWSRGARTVESDTTLDGLFAVQLAEAPNAVAVRWTKGTLTYAQLHRRAMFVAERLPEGKRIAVVMEKGWEQIVAVLAVHYAGSAYVPIDDSLPGIRRNVMLEKAGAKIALVQHGTGDAEWPHDVERIVVGGGENDGPSPIMSRPDELAYVIFTSGSTGEPKGVMIDHRGAVNTCLDVNRRRRMTHRDRVLALSALSFDLSVWDIWGAFAAGATIVIPDADSAKEPGHWADLVRTEGVTVWNSVPALLELYLDYLESHPEHGGTTLRAALLSGDWIPLALPPRFRAAAPNAEVIAMGGATEASIWSIDFPVGQVDPHWRSIPYGRPMANQDVFVLDARMQPCEMLVVGQIYIGGRGIARGYWKSPEETAACFIIHPVSGERIYRTGDLGRWLPDGHVEFLGREDFQVKVQGFRIELEEIEAALRVHPGVGSAAVVAVGLREEGKRLAAYVVPRDGQSPVGGDLMVFLRQRLPGYMVPATFSVLNSFPLSANGKVDRKALPAPSQSELPECEMDELSALVAGVFRCGKIDEELNFLQHGVSSIEMISLASALERRFGIRPKLARLYKEPTIGALRRMLRESGVVAPHVARISLGEPGVSADVGPESTGPDWRNVSTAAIPPLLRRGWNSDRRALEQTVYNVHLDWAQLDALVAGGARNVSLARPCVNEPMVAQASPDVPRLDESQKGDGRPPSPERGSNWMRLNADGKKQPFIFLHGNYFGGDYCRDLADLLGPDQPVIAVHPHGTTGGILPGSIREMAADRIAGLKRAGFKGPWILGGYCNGAFVALEMARQLEAAGEDAPLVILLMANGSRVRFRMVKRWIRALHFKANDETLEKRFVRVRNRLLAWEWKLKRVVEKVLGPRKSEVKVMKRDQPAVGQACFLSGFYLRAIDGYVPGEFGGKLLCLWPAQEDNAWHHGDAARGWRDVSSSATGHLVPGDHFSIFTDAETQQAVAEKIRGFLE